MRTYWTHCYNSGLIPSASRYRKLSSLDTIKFLQYLYLPKLLSDHIPSGLPTKIIRVQLIHKNNTIKNIRFFHKLSYACLVLLHA
jgi:hypothetical protein